MFQFQIILNCSSYNIRRLWWISWIAHFKSLLTKMRMSCGFDEAINNLFVSGKITNIYLGTPFHRVNSYLTFAIQVGFLRKSLIGRLYIFVSWSALTAFQFLGVTIYVFVPICIIIILYPFNFQKNYCSTASSQKQLRSKLKKGWISVFVVWVTDLYFQVQLLGKTWISTPMKPPFS